MFNGTARTVAYRDGLRLPSGLVRSAAKQNRELITVTVHFLLGSPGHR